MGGYDVSMGWAWGRHALHPAQGLWLLPSQVRAPGTEQRSRAAHPMAQRCQDPHKVPSLGGTHGTLKKDV